MKIITIIGASLLGSASAASSQVVTMLLPNMNDEPWVASVVGENDAATTYAVNCGSGTSDDCGGVPGFTAMQGSKTAGYYFSLTASDVLVSYGCSVGGSTTAICTEAVTGTGAMSPGTSTFTLGPSDLPLMEQPVTVTAGSITQDTSSATSAVSAVSAASAASAASATTTSGGPPSSTNTSSDTSTAATKTSKASAVSTASSTGGSMPLITGNVKLSLGGAVLALAAAGI
ncbi:hypothetical protein BGW36DRAFT_386843 [Talaromyces proteolyticus]|uniref:GPI anchored protein n=1 Tax=Talaromyces proteolyticus TaxID=1131652 RepID=A0AAD4PWU4_9EURO|nr:uncharacterized protein BGW36DRAFT_386843 [Talaromyces proteolyticus]KAH8692024.1 hypothetical protein BGW36DRAFT_386843 [Talaromyces proteolyticus]